MVDCLWECGGEFLGWQVERGLRYGWSALWRCMAHLDR